MQVGTVGAPAPGFYFGKKEMSGPDDITAMIRDHFGDKIKDGDQVVFRRVELQSGHKSHPRDVRMVKRLHLLGKLRQWVTGTPNHLVVHFIHPQPFWPAPALRGDSFVEVVGIEGRNNTERLARFYHPEGKMFRAILNRQSGT